jgi:arylsulfatase A-like enzyme
MYDATIRAADRMVEQLLDQLDRLGLEEDTLVLITSDHGEEFMEHGSVWHMKTVYEELIRVPLLIRVPGIKGGARVKTCVSQVDVMPTLLELMGVECPASVQGRSLVSLLRGEPEKDRFVYAETRMPTKSSRACIIREGWKYIEGSQDESLRYPAPAPFEVYNLAEDPGEQNNLYGTFPKVDKNLGGLMRKLETQFRQEHDALDRGEGPPHALSAELLEVLKQQGYL